MVTKNFEVQSVVHRHDVIEFTWTDLGGTYLVYRDALLLYEGNVAKFRDGQFNHAKMYHYTIEHVVNDKVVDVIALQTTAFAQERNAKNPLQFLVMTTIVAKTQIAFAWEEINDVKDYKVYRNGTFLRQVQNNQYIDRNFSLDESYTYEIRSKRPLAKSKEKLSKGKSVFAAFYGLFIPPSYKKSPAVERFTVTKVITNPRQLLIPFLQRRKRKSIDEWQFRYTTFLKETLIKNPNRFSANQFFKGDGRDFNVTDPNYRTRVDVDLNYGLRASPMTCTRSIGETVAVNRFGRIQDKAVAKEGGIAFEKNVHQQGELGFLLTHAVENPLVTAPSIDYEVRAVLRRDGLFDLTGYHDQAPHHEIYLVRGMDQAWVPIHLAESEGLAWMSGLTGWHYWRYSNFE